MKFFMSIKQILHVNEKYSYIFLKINKGKGKANFFLAYTVIYYLYKLYQFFLKHFCIFFNLTVCILNKS